MNSLLQPLHMHHLWLKMPPMDLSPYASINHRNLLYIIFTLRTRTQIIPLWSARSTKTNCWCDLALLLVNVVVLLLPSQSSTSSASLKDLETRGMIKRPRPCSITDCETVFGPFSFARGRCGRSARHPSDDSDDDWGPPSESFKNSPKF